MKKVLQPFTNESTSPVDAFTASTVHSQMKPIDRDGLYFSVFNKMLEPDYKKIPHILCSGFACFNDTKIFYRFKGKLLSNEKNGLALFHLNPESCPLETLEDALSWMKGYSLKWKAFYHFDVNLKDPGQQLYVSRFYQLISDQLGYVPEALSSTDLQKQSSFEGTAVLEAGTQWTWLDNQLLHAVLSKGAAYLQPELEGAFAAAETLELSPFHQLEILERKEAGTVKKWHEDKLMALNYFQNPQDMKIFYHLITKNIFSRNS